MKALIIAVLGTALCACSSSDSHPYSGQQQKWPFVLTEFEGRCGVKKLVGRAARSPGEEYTTPR